MLVFDKSHSRFGIFSKTKVFHEAGGQPTRYFMRPGVNPLWRQPQRSLSLSPQSSRLAAVLAPTLQTETPLSQHPSLPLTPKLTSPLPTINPLTTLSFSPQNVYINEALCKSRGKLSFAARNLKRNNKINDTWTVDGRIKIRTIHNRIVNIDTMTELETYM